VRWLAGWVADALVQTATHPLDSLNYALNSILPTPGVKPDEDPNPLIDANSGKRKRHQWIAAGCKWFDHNKKPPHWDFNLQCEHIPEAFR
jgi:hypothetical protein